MAALVFLWAVLIGGLVMFFVPAICATVKLCVCGALSGEEGKQAALLGFLGLILAFAAAATLGH